MSNEINERNLTPTIIDYFRYRRIDDYAESHISRSIFGLFFFEFLVSEFLLYETITHNLKLSSKH